MSNDRGAVAEWKDHGATAIRFLKDLWTYGGTVYIWSEEGSAVDYPLLTGHENLTHVVSLFIYQVILFFLFNTVNHGNRLESRRTPYRPQVFNEGSQDRQPLQHPSYQTLQVPRSSY